MKKFRKVLSLAVALVMALTVFTGCGNSSNEEVTVASTDAEVTEAVAEATTTEEVTTTTEVTTEAVTTTTEATTAVTTEATTVTVATTEETTSAYTVEEMSAVMYAKSSVNVRSGPSTDYDRIGHLDEGEEVTVTGLASTGWYRISFEGGEGYVSNNYLVTEKPATTTATTTTAATTAATIAATTTATTAATTASTASTTSSSEIWVASWGTSMQTAWSSDTIPSEATSGSTVTIRQQIRPSLGGDEVRFVISNQYGKTDLVIDSMELAMLNSPSSYKIDTSTRTTVTYNGSTKITVPAGKTITTDAISFSFDALDDIAVSMKISSMPSTITLHRASRCTNWVVTGSHVSDNSWSSASEFKMWYFLAEMDVMADSSGGAIVCLGDSLTDGASIDNNSFARYTDKLAELLQADSSLDNYSVINMGVGATNFLGTTDNSTGLGRVTRDIVNVAGVEYCIVYMGVNDIGGATTDISQKIIDGYEKLIKECHEAGIKVIGCTITPFNGSSYYSELHEQIRLTVNKHITSSSSDFDGYIDLASAVASSSDSSKMDSKYVSTWNDYLHFNATGYRYVGTTIYNYLKDFIS